METIRSLPTAGFVVIVVILLLFVLAVALLLIVCGRYRRLTALRETEENSFRSTLLREYSAAFQKYGRDVNTPAIISNVVGDRLSGMLLCERFLNNAVSLFVTLGLFGTFLGLSLSVASLTKLISLSNTDQWLNVLDSVGGGLMSALSGMGVAFYTSLVGAGCSILLTILRTILNPQAEREKLETRLELWLDTEVAPELAADNASDDAGLVRQMTGALNNAAAGVRASLSEASDALVKTASLNRLVMEQFDKTVAQFKEGVHDYAEVDYNLRGSAERLDLAVRDFSGAVKELGRRIEGAEK